MVAGWPIQLSPAPSLSHPTAVPSVSADGQRVLWFGPTPYYNVWDASSLANIYSSATVSSAVLSPTGARVIYQNPGAKLMAVYDLAGRTNVFSCTNATPIQSSAPWSGDGRFVTFVSGAPLVSNDQNGTNDVYLCDLQTGMLTLISANSNWMASASGVSDSPAISGDARFIAFRSFAPDVVAGITNTPSLFLFDRTTGLNRPLATAAADSWTFWASRPVASSNGSTVAFSSWNVSTAVNDRNRVQDVYASSQASLIVDSDNDGIPDWWMLQYFGHPTGEAGDLSRASDDADGTGLDNLQKYLTGTDPTNPNSIFAVQISAPAGASNTASLTWPAVPGKSYQVLYTDDLESGVWSVYSGSLAIIGRQGSITVPAAPAARFYRAVFVY
jgi:hypothetical protein